MSSLQYEQQLPGGWHLARFDEFLKRIERKIFLDDSAPYDCVGVRWYGNGAFIRERLLGLNISRKQQWIIKIGDIVYNKLFAWKGSFALADGSVDGCIVSDKFPTYEADLTKIDSNFLRYYFHTTDLALQALNLSKGGAAISKLTLNPPQFWDLTIPLPPLSEQRRIVARIEELAVRIEEARGLRREAVEEAEVLMDTVTYSLFDELEKHYAKRFLRNSAKILGGGTPSKANVAFWQGKIPWVSPKDMKVHNLYDSEDHISELALQSGATTLIPKNSILVVVRSGILRRKLPISINRVPVTINQDMKALIPDNDILCDFLAWWFKGKEAVILKHVKGGTTVQSVVWGKVQMNVTVWD
jgi:type I restriction enzyme S subunit